MQIGIHAVAKSLLSLTLKAVKAAERERVRQNKAAIREYNAEIRERERATKAREVELRKTAVANERERKKYEKELQAAHVASQLAEVDSMNSQINDTFNELEGLLQSTIDVDDFVDLELLRKSEKNTPFDKPELEAPLSKPDKPRLPLEPSYKAPEKPKGFFGKKKKLEAATAIAKQTYENAKANWEKDVTDLQSKYQADANSYVNAEKARIVKLAKEKERFLQELKQYNKDLDQFISNLAYGAVDAIQEYVTMVVENSNYPDHFNVTHEFSFETTSAELSMKVAVPPPSCFPSIKSCKYVKASDEIKETPLSKTELKKRYCSAVYQVAIRSLHEIFEADRRGLIKTISLEVGTNDNDPATGISGFIPFVGTSAERETFVEFDLSSVVPHATLTHLGAAISKDPTSLIAADTSGVRKS